MRSHGILPPTSLPDDIGERHVNNMLRRWLHLDTTLPRAELHKLRAAAVRQGGGNICDRGRRRPADVGKLQGMCGTVYFRGQ